MGKLKKSHGNMYDWVTHMWGLGNGCPHQCTYCYVRKWRELPETLVIERPFPALGSGRTIFVGHTCDLFAEGVPDEVIEEVVEHCRRFDNDYVFQTKNPKRMWEHRCALPRKSLLGTTIETNRGATLALISKAPPPMERAMWLSQFSGDKFVTVEPILDFDPDLLTAMLATIKPTFVNIGADSKDHDLPEPSGEKVLQLVEKLGAAGITIRKKVNLDRLLKKSA